MPLIKSDSNSARQKNIETEMRANPGKDSRAKNLAIAYSVQRRAKKKNKMSGGGKVDVDQDNQSLMREDGVGSKQDAPSLSRYSDGGNISLEQSKSGAQSSMKPLMRNAQMDNEPPVPGRKPDDERLSKDEYMSSSAHTSSIPRGPRDDMRPSESEYMADQAVDGSDEHYSNIADAILNKKRKMMASGGGADDDSMGSGGGTNQGGQTHKAGLLPSFLADGGEIGEGEDDEMSSSRKSRRDALPEGAVDIEQNGEVEPNFFYHQNEDAALKENYDEDLSDESQPMDSNEHSDSPDSRDQPDKFDMVDDIRRKMKAKKSRM